MKNNILNEKKLTLFFSVYMILQPIIDTLTSFCVRYISPSFTVGIVFRTLFLGACFLYLIFVYKGKSRRLIYVYLSILSLYTVFFLIYHYATGSLAIMIVNLKAIIKTIYFPVSIISLYALYQSNIKAISKRTLAFIGIIYISFILIALVTGTSFKTYWAAYGYNGWFFAANETGAIISSLCPIVVLWAMSLKGWYKYIIMAAVAFISSYIGTKVAFLIIVIYIALYAGWNFISFIIDKKNKELLKRALAALLTVVLSVLIMLANSPLYKNFTTVLLDNLLNGLDDKYAIIDPTKPTDGPVEDFEVPVEIEPSDTWKIMNWILSNRLKNLQIYIENQKTVPFIEKIIGIGHTGIAEKITIELDFIAYFYYNGILGMCIILLPFLLLLISMISYVLRHFKYFFSKLNLCTYMYSFIALIMIGALTGHTFTAPAVSIYIPIMWLIFNFEKDKK